MAKRIKKPQVAEPDKANPPFSARKERYYLAASFLFPLLCYLLTAGHSVNFEDSGIFLSSGAALGLPQPPGYPLYSLLSHLFSLLPLGSLAYRIHIFSALCGAGAALLTYLSARKLNLAPWCALFAAGCLAFSDTYWSQMIVAEVYPLHILLFCSLFYTSLLIRENPSDKRFLVFGGLLGLALSNHWPLLVLAAPTLTAYAWSVRAKIVQRAHVWLLPALFISASFYLAMMWRSQQDPQFSFLGPITNLKELYAYVSRSHYQAIEALSLPYWEDKPWFVLSFIFRIVWHEWLVLGGVLFIAGIIGAKRIARAEQIGLFLGIFTTSVLLLFLLHLEFNSRNVNTLKVFHLVPIFCLSLLFSYGAHFLKTKFGVKAVLVVTALLGVAAVKNFTWNDLRTDRFAEDYVDLLLHVIPRTEVKKVLIAGADEDVGPLAYVLAAKKLRPDIIPASQSGLFFRERILDPKPATLKKRANDTAEYFKKNHTIYSTKFVGALNEVKNLPTRVHFNGLFYEFTAGSPEHLNVGDESIESAKAILDRYIENPRASNWPYYREVIVARLCNFVVLRTMEHPAFQKITACRQILARHLSSLKRFAEADQIFKSLLEQSRMMFSRERQELRYHQLVNRMEWVNSDPGTLDEKLVRVRKYIDEATPGLVEYPQCDNNILIVVNSLKSRVSISSETEQALSKFKKCEKIIKGRTKVWTPTDRQ